jgi:hypothetical protein
MVLEARSDAPPPRGDAFDGASPFVERHAPALAQSLAELLRATGHPCTVGETELAVRTSIPLFYVRALGRRHTIDVNAFAAPLGFIVSVTAGMWRCSLIAH